jgi:hypothetical protein
MYEASDLCIVGVEHQWPMLAAFLPLLLDGFARKASITLPFDVQLYQQFALRLRLLVIIFGLDEIEPANLPCFPREQHISFLLL